MTPHAGQPGQSAPRAKDADTAGTDVPAIPECVKEWRAFPLAAAFVIVAGADRADMVAAIDDDLGGIFDAVGCSEDDDSGYDAYGYFAHVMAKDD